MSDIVLSTPKLGFIVATRAALALGGGLLLSSQLGHRKRRVIGGTLVAVGALTTIPALMLIRRSRVTNRRPRLRVKAA
jgi:hypothetical protein